jgi:hypothetical protein
MEVAWGGFDRALAVGQIFMSVGEADFSVRWIEGGGDWKVARTGRLESLPYAIVAPWPRSPQSGTGLLGSRSFE